MANAKSVSAGPAGALPIALAAAAVAFAAGCPAVPETPRDIPVLMYHNILPPEECDSVYKVSADEFAAQLDALAAAGFETILPDDIARAARRRKRLPRKPVVLTFDDGYEGIPRYAEPLLAARGMKGICYAITDRLARDGEPRGVFDSGPLMTAAEAGAMARRGVIALGVHSRTHSLPPEVLVPEVSGGRRALRKRTGVESASYSYPFGQWGVPGMTNAVAGAGYATAVICGNALFRFGPGADLLRIPRLSVFGGTHAVGIAALDPAAGRVALTNGGMRIPLRVAIRAPDGSIAATSGVERVASAPVLFDFGKSFPEGSSAEAWDAAMLFRYDRSTPNDTEKQ